MAINIEQGILFISVGCEIKYRYAKKTLCLDGFLIKLVVRKSFYVSKKCIKPNVVDQNSFLIYFFT